jgi:hypothetical protein
VRDLEAIESSKTGLDDQATGREPERCCKISWTKKLHSYMAVACSPWWHLARRSQRPFRSRDHIFANHFMLLFERFVRD